MGGLDDEGGGEEKGWGKGNERDGADSGEAEAGG